MRARTTTGLLLGLILAFGAVMRFTGQNWDDFSHSHPDERFLTELLLPQIGGHNTFTGDERSFPAQEVFVASETSEVSSWSEIRERGDIRLAALRGSFSAEAASWLVDSQRLRLHDDLRQIEAALFSGEADALVVGRQDAANFANSLTGVDTIRSEDLQSLRCKQPLSEFRWTGRLLRHILLAAQPPQCRARPLRIRHVSTVSGALRQSILAQRHRKRAAVI